MTKSIKWQSAALSALFLMVAGSALDALSLTGNVETDFALAEAVIVTDGTAPDVGLPGRPEWASVTSGWDIKDFRFFYDPADDSLYLGINFFGIAGMRMETAILRPQALHSLRSEDRILQTWEDPRRSRSSSIGIVTGYSTQLQVFRRMRMPRLSRLLQICHPGLSYSEILTVSARRLFLAPVGLLAGQSLRPTSS